MKTFILVLLIALNSHFAFAQFEKIEYRGRDKNTNAPCKLYVNNAGFTSDNQVPENYFMDVLPKGFSHGIDSSGPFTLRPYQGNPNILFSQNGYDEMVLFFENGDYLNGTPTGYNVKWLHGNHYHYDICRNLQKIK